MKRIAFAIAAALPLSLSVIPSVPLAAQAPAPVTLGEWLANDREVQQLAAGPARDAAIAAHIGALTQGFTTARDQQRAKAAAGEQVDACLPPPGSELSLTLREIGTWLQERPSREHGDAMSEVLTRFLAERYPCR